MLVKPGDLVESVRYKRIGIVTEVFDELDLNNPWVRVLFTHPVETYQWCKKEGLTIISKKEGDPSLDPPLLGATGGSGSL